MYYKNLGLCLALLYSQTTQAPVSREGTTKPANSISMEQAAKGTLQQILDFHKSSKNLETYKKIANFTAGVSLLQTTYFNIERLYKYRTDADRCKGILKEFSITAFKTLVFNKGACAALSFYHGSSQKIITRFAKLLKTATELDRQKALELFENAKLVVAAKTCLSTESKTRQQALIADLDKVLTKIVELS